MIKILHISKFYYPYIGGIEDVCYNIVKLLQSKGEYEQKVFCFNDTNSTIYDNYEDVQVTRAAVIKTLASQPISTVYKKELKKMVTAFQPDVIHFHAPNPLSSCVLMGLIHDKIKLIVHWHSDIVSQKVIYLLIKSAETKMLRHADVIIATSPNYIQYSKPLQRFIDKVTVIQNIINPDKFVLTTARRLQIEAIKEKYDYKPILLFVGRHVSYKGLQHLIRAASIVVNDCAIVIGGKGTLTEELKEINKSEKVHFVGRIADDELVAHLYAADIFVFPSVTKNEAFGIALAEAMYCETPTVTFEIKGSGVNWVSVNEETGLEVQNGNCEKLAETLDKLIEDDVLRKQLAIQAKKRIEKLFLMDKISEEIVKLYR